MGAAARRAVRPGRGRPWRAACAVASALAAAGRARAAPGAEPAPWQRWCPAALRFPSSCPAPAPLPLRCPASPGALANATHPWPGSGFALRHVFAAEVEYGRGFNNGDGVALHRRGGAPTYGEILPGELLRLRGELRLTRLRSQALPEGDSPRPQGAPPR